MLLGRYGTVLLRSTRFVSSRVKLKDYVFPEIREEDCVQKLMSGWGPGGQNVNKSQNAINLKHIPTGVVVRVHESRSVFKNMEIARERLKLAVDRAINGENCYEEQLRRLESQKEAKMKKKRAAEREFKKNLASEETASD